MTITSTTPLDALRARHPDVRRHFLCHAYGSQIRKTEDGTTNKTMIAQIEKTLALYEIRINVICQQYQSINGKTSTTETKRSSNIAK